MKKQQINASSVARYEKCPGSYSLEQTIPKELRYNAFEGAASLGRQIHAAGENALKVYLAEEKTTPLKLLKAEGIDRKHPDYDKALNAIKEYRKYFVKVHKQRNKEYKNVMVEIEKKYNTAVSGVRCVFKADALIVSQTNDGTGLIIDFFDLKTGNWDYSESAASQMRFSLNILLAKVDYKNVLCNTHVVQPNFWNPVNTISVNSFTFSTDAARVQLRDLVSYLALASEQFSFGDHCALCPAVIMCPEKKYFMSLLQGFMSVYSGTIEEMPPEKLELIWMHKKSFETFLKAVEQCINAMLENGTNFEHLYKKLSYGNRRWIDKDLVIKRLAFLGEKLFEPQKLKSPAQIEKLAGKENITDLYIKPERYVVAEKEHTGDIFDELD